MKKYKYLLIFSLVALMCLVVGIGTIISIKQEQAIALKTFDSVQNQKEREQSDVNAVKNTLNTVETSEAEEKSKNLDKELEELNTTKDELHKEVSESGK